MLYYGNKTWKNLSFTDNDERNQNRTPSNRESFLSYLFTLL